MTPQELRIGNLVRYNGEVINVEQITKKKIGYHAQENRMHYTQIAELKPIPLTEEIIGKYFIHHGANYYRDNSRVEIYQTRCGWCLSLNNSPYTAYINTIVKYFHEVQNAYYLAMGKELTKI